LALNASKSFSAASLALVAASEPSAFYALAASLAAFLPASVTVLKSIKLVKSFF